MFILYLTDLHNLGVEGTVQVVANPLNPVRKIIEAPIVNSPDTCDRDAEFDMLFVCCVFFYQHFPHGHKVM